MKKKITLHRKLPAVIHFTGTTFQVKVTSRDPKHADVAAILKDRLETELAKSNPHLQADEKSPELVITCIVTSFDLPPEEHFSKNETVMTKAPPNAQGKQQTRPTQVAVEYKKIKGSLDVSYEARERNQHTVDAKNVPAKYSEDFGAATNQPVSQSSMSDPFKRIFGKKPEASAGPPSPSELRDKLIDEAVNQIAPRITTTNETIEVLLARGKLDEANKSAEGGLWTRYLEQLEQMTPFPKTKDDAYRLYNIGVAYEALAYQSESEDAAKKSLQEAAINYGRAVDAKPDEKNFIEPQKRIETAMGYLRKLEAERKAFEAANEQSAKSEPATSATPANAASADDKSAAKTANKTSNKVRTTASTKAPQSTGASGDADPAKPSNGAAKPPAKTPAKTTASRPVEVLTNDKVIMMSKEHVDEATIIATIRDAAAVDFDLSVDGNIALTHGGVSSNVLAAMRARAKKQSQRTAGPGST